MSFVMIRDDRLDLGAEPMDKSIWDQSFDERISEVLYLPQFSDVSR